MRPRHCSQESRCVHQAPLSARSLATKSSASRSTSRSTSPEDDRLSRVRRQCCVAVVSVLCEFDERRLTPIRCRQLGPRLVVYSAITRKGHIVLQYHQSTLLFQALVIAETCLGIELALVLLGCENGEFWSWPVCPHQGRKNG